MEQKPNDQEVLLVVEKDGNELKAVTGLNEDGTPVRVQSSSKQLSRRSWSRLSIPLIT